MNNLLQTWIKEHLFTKTGKVNNRIEIDSWWSNRSNYTPYLKQIQEKTSFLPEKSKLNQRIYHIIHNLKEIPKCYCGKYNKFDHFTTGYHEYCSLNCSWHGKNRNEKIGKNRDTKDILQKCKETNLKKYGVEFFFQTENFKSKARKTKIKNYGNPNYCNINKVQETNLKKYGVPFYILSKDNLHKNQEASALKHPLLRNGDWLREQNYEKKLSVGEIADLLGVTRRSVYYWFDKHNIQPIFYQPKYNKMEDDIYNELQKIYVGPIIRNDRNSIKPKELDFYFPDKKIAIELCGLYWHREDKNKHLAKLKICQAQNIRLLQFWDVEWIEKREICLSIIKNVLGLTSKKVMARKCEINDVSNKEYKDFLEENHIQGFRPAKFKCGLFYNSELVSVIGIGKNRYSKETNYELIRFGVKNGIVCVGGLSKMLKYADKKPILTYTDLRLFTGFGYEKVGFKLIRESLPNYFYTKQRKIKSRLACQKHKIKSFLETFDENKSEYQNMKDNGYYRVFDCGNKVYISHLSL